MQIDKEEHREILLQMLKASTIPGNALDAVYEVKQALLEATVKPDPAE